MLALVVMLVVGAAASLVLLQRQGDLTDKPFSLSNDGRVIPSDAERHKVVAVAEQFCLRVDAFDGDDPDKYRELVTEMLTTKYKKAFDTEFGAIEQLGIQKGQQGKGTIVASGVGTWTPTARPSWSCTTTRSRPRPAPPNGTRAGRST